MNAGPCTTRTESMVQAGHRKLFVTEAGSGPPVVLLHGGGPGATGVSNYSSNIDASRRQHFRVIVPDMPGYGRSSKDLDHSDPFGDLAFRDRRMLDELGIDKAHLVGNSYGGAAALRLTLDRPDRVDRLVLMGPGGIGTTRALPTKGLTKLFELLRRRGPVAGQAASRSSATTWSSTALPWTKTSSTSATRRVSSPTWWRTRRCAGRAGPARCGRSAHGLHPRPPAGPL